MLHVVELDLEAALNTNDVLVLPNDFDEMRFSDVGHVLVSKTLDNRYTAPTDFTLECDGSGTVTLTWLHADTLAADTEVRLGVAYVDQIVNGSGTGGAGGAGLATEATLDGLRDDINTPVTAQPPIVPEPIGGTNGVLAVKVNQVGAGTAVIEAADADEIWDIVGWRLSFSAACTVTFSVDDDDASRQYALDIPSAGIDSEAPGNFAWFTGNVNEPVGITNSAGNMKGVVYVRKHS